MTRPGVSVLVPTYRRPLDLARCLAALRDQERPADEVLIVLRDTDAETREFLTSADFSPLKPRIAEVVAAGVVAAMNAGLAAATCEIIAITDDDAAPRPDWLRRIEGYFHRSARIGGVGGRDLLHPANAETRRQVRDVGRVHWYGRVTGNHHIGAGGPRRVDVLKGVNCAFRREAIAPFGFDQRLRGEGAQPHWELRLCLQVRRQGWILVYDPTLVVDHFVAPKIEGDVRGSSSRLGLANDVYNETYALLRGLSPGRAAAALLYALLVGRRSAPGLALAGRGLLRKEARPSALSTFRLSTAARLRAIPI